MKSKIALGIMSGTSADGISIASVSFLNKNIRLHHYQTFPYPSSVVKQVSKGPRLTASEISKLNIELGHLYANSVNKFLKINRISSKNISVIGSHGQTVYHGPYDSPSNTFQIGEPSIIAEKTGIPVVADFRMADIACGGQGAPLIPFFDQYFFGNGKVCALQNIGGISNVTVVGNNRFITAFDNGPGNCLIDWCVRKITKDKKRFDKDGKIALSGAVQMKFIKTMMKHPYFKLRPPKSTGRELFNEQIIPLALLKAKSEDLVATLTYFTALSIAESYQRFVRQKIQEVIVSGGGALNLALMVYLKALLLPVPVYSIEELGIPAQAKEPAAFAFFALQAINNKPNHCPQATGAKRRSILGKTTIILSSPRKRGSISILSG